MTARFLKLIFLFFALNLALTVRAQVANAVDWPKFLSQHDMIWEVLPLQWNEGAFTGNGQVGMMIYATLKDNRIDFHIGRESCLIKSILGNDLQLYYEGNTRQMKTTTGKSYRLNSNFL